MAFPPKKGSAVPQSQAMKVQSHHSSPEPGDVQTDPFGVVPTNVPVSGGSKKQVPPHVTKHPNPVGRPKAPRY